MKGGAVSGSSTRPSLLVRIRDRGDRAAWEQFAELYTPLLLRFARRHGLQEADAHDLVQEVLKAVTTAAERLEYDPRRGSFRGWLYAVARSKLSNLLAARARQAQGSGDSGVQGLLEQQPAADDSAEWDAEYERRLFAWAAEQVRAEFQEKTWQAFWRTAVEGRPAGEVAAALGLSVGAVYVAKSRVMARLKEQVQELHEE
jgi:RNA polymerase sigma-70 factor (ECF subfamily)